MARQSLSSKLQQLRTPLAVLSAAAVKMFGRHRNAMTKMDLGPATEGVEEAFVGMDATVALPLGIALALLLVLITVPSKASLLSQHEDNVAPPGWSLKRFYFLFLIWSGVYIMEWWERALFSCIFGGVVLGLGYSVFSAAVLLQGVVLQLQAAA